MNIHEAFKQQIETTALLVESDLGNNKGIPIAWNGVILDCQTAISIAAAKR